jgi:hypothetical protein
MIQFSIKEFHDRTTFRHKLVFIFRVILKQYITAQKGVILYDIENTNYCNYVKVLGDSRNFELMSTEPFYKITSEMMQVVDL